MKTKSKFLHLTTHHILCFWAICLLSIQVLSAQNVTLPGGRATFTVEGKSLNYDIARGGNFDCFFHDSRSTNNAVVWINGEHRYISGYEHRDSARVLLGSIDLRDDEIGKEIRVQLAIYQRPCTGGEDIIYSQDADLFVPFYEDFGNGTGLTAYGIPDDKCGFKFLSRNGVSTSSMTSAIQREVYNRPDRSIVLSKGNQEYSFKFDFGSKGYTRITYHTGAYGEHEQNPQNLSISGSSASFTYKPNRLYMNQARNYTRLLVLKCYQGSQLKQQVVVPVIVVGSDIDFTRDTNGQFKTTKSAPIVNMVLHNTPGDESFSYLSQSTNVCTDMSMSFSQGNGQSASLKVSVGTESSVLGIIDISSEFSISGSYSRSLTQGTSTSSQLCREITSRVENKNSLIGEDGDLFMGSYMTYRYGPAITVEYRTSGGNCTVRANNKSIVFVPEEVEDFNYTKYNIEQDIIPLLEEEKAALASGSKEWKELDRNIRAWQDMIHQNHQNIISAPALSGTKIFYGDQGSQGADIAIQRTESFSTESSLIIDKSLLIEAGVSVGGTGVSTSAEIAVTNTVSKGTSSSTTTTQTIGYSLQDDDAEDVFRLKVKKDQTFGTHIFQLLNNSRTSCPFEGGYQLNQPRLRVMDNGTEKREVNIYALKGTAAQIPLRVINGSDYPSTYRLSGGNLANAVVELGANGIGLNEQNKDYALEGNEAITLNPSSGLDLLYVRQNPNSPNQLNYEGIEIILSATCEEDRESIQDKVTLNVYFQDQLEVSPQNQTVSAEAGTLSYSVTSDAAWSVAENISWASVSPNSGNGNGSFTLTYDENTALAPRTGTFEVRTANGTTKAISITQQEGLYQCDNWVSIASEGQTLEFDEGDQYIRYGSEGEYVTKLVASGTPCTNATFGDPNPGTPKACFKCDEIIDRSSGLGTGLRATYFDNSDFTGTAITRIDSVVNFNWGTGSPDPSMGNNHYSVVWEGEVEAGFSEVYTFYTRSDDGVRLWVNDHLIIDQWRLQSTTEHSGIIPMEAGERVAIRLEYYEIAGYANARLSWESENVSKQVIAQGNLFPADCSANDEDLDGVSSSCDNCPEYAGRALSFDGVNDHITFTTPQNIPVANSHYTLEAWFYANTMGNKGIIGWGSYRRANQVNALRLSNNGFRHYWWGNDLDATTGNITGAWHHVAVTYDGAIRVLYLDGSVVAIDSANSHAVPHANNLTIGKTFRNEYFDGKIDEVRVWNLALDSVALNAQMKQELAGDETGLVAYFRFNEGEIERVNSTITTLTDLSTNGNHGTLNGFALDSTVSNWVAGAPLAHHDSDGDGIGDPCDEDFLIQECENWQQVASENQTVTFEGEGERYVRYGANGQYVYKKVVSGTPCSNGIFGNPIHGVVKDCSICLDDAPQSRMAAPSEDMAIATILLGQNYPNPTTGITTIPLEIPQGVEKASITIIAIDGRIVGTYDIEERGATRLEIQTRNLAEGIYVYNFVADGELIGSKRMSVAK